MINILITTLLFSCIIIIFKFFEKYKVDNLQALIFNYITAGTLALFLSDASLSVDIFSKPWFFHSVIIGILFIIVFNFYAFGTQKVGVAISTVANKMSLIIPVLVSLYLYKNDTLTIYKVVGLSFACIGIVLASLKGGKLVFNKSYLWIIIAIFVGQGIADTLFANAQGLIKSNENELFFVVLFIFASITGLIILSGKSIKNKLTFEFKNILWGVVLGVVNYYCLYFMGLALKTKGLSNSEVFPLVSMGVVLASAIIGVAIYKQNLSKGNWIGIGFAVLAIAVINFGKYLY